MDGDILSEKQSFHDLMDTIVGDLPDTQIEIKWFVDKIETDKEDIRKR